MWVADYDAVGVGSSVQDAWQVEQEPTNPGTSGTVQTSRITVASASKGAGTGTVAPTQLGMRVELRPYETTNGAADGDVTDTGGYLANRAEVYARHAVPGATLPNGWPDPAGVERWYGFSLLIPTGHVFATDTTWLTFTQWKGRDGDSPPIGLEIARDRLRLGGARGNAGAFPNSGDIGAATPGTWTRLVVGLRLSTDPALGWVEVWRDGAQVVARTAVSTMDFQSDGTSPDPVYLKQGIYRSTAWQTTHVLWFGPMRIGRTKAAVS